MVKLGNHFSFEQRYSLVPWALGIVDSGIAMIYSLKNNIKFQTSLIIDSSATQSSKRFLLSLARDSVELTGNSVYLYFISKILADPENYKPFPTLTIIASSVFGLRALFCPIVIREFKDPASLLSNLIRVGFILITTIISLSYENRVSLNLIVIFGFLFLAPIYAGSFAGLVNSIVSLHKLCATKVK